MHNIEDLRFCFDQKMKLMTNLYSDRLVRQNKYFVAHDY